MIPCHSKVSIVVKSAACSLEFYARGGALFRATFNRHPLLLDKIQVF